MVLGILLSGCATTETIVSSGKIKKNISKSQLSDAFLTSYPSEDPLLPGAGSEYHSEVASEIIWGENQKKYYVFRYVSEPVSCANSLIAPIRIAIGAFVNTNSAPCAWHCSATFQAIDCSFNAPKIIPFFPFNKLFDMSQSLIRYTNIV